jgi:hypothetical protein
MLKNGFRILGVMLLIVTTLPALAQEDKLPESDDARVRKPPGSEFETSETPANTSGSTGKKKKTNPKPKGPYISAEHKRSQREYYFEVGEYVKFKSGSEKEIKRGVIESIEGNMFTVNGQKVSVRNLDMIGKKWGETMKWRTKGISQIAIGTGIAAVGVSFAVVSAQFINLDSPRIVWGTFGATIGAGTALVGFHLMGKGGKAFFQPSKLWKEKGWSFKTK